MISRTILPQFYKIYISLPCKFSIIFLAIVSHSCGLLSNVPASKSRTNILYISFFNVSTSVSKVSICASSMLISSYSSEGAVAAGQKIDRIPPVDYRFYFFKCLAHKTLSFLSLSRFGFSVYFQLFCHSSINNRLVRMSDIPIKPASPP